MNDGKIFRSEAKDVVGEIEWDLQDCETGEIIESGKRQISAEEVTIEWQLQPPTNWFLRTLKNLFLSKYGFYNKTIQLGEKSFLQMCEFPKKRQTGIRGFGMSAATEKDNKSFCWEWFEVKNDSTAIKLQETGELEISFEEVDSRWEIGETQFHSDISFRICPYSMEKTKETEPKWRLNIRKGSYANWPVVCNGEVIFNAQQSASVGRG
jgi:hypothetical protein